MLITLLGYAIFNQFGTDEAKEAAAKGFNQAMILLLGVLIVIVGIVFVVGGSKAGQLAGSVGELIATKGASLAS